MPNVTDSWLPLRCVLALTRVVIDMKKQRVHDRERAQMLKRWNWAWLCAELGVSAAIWVATSKNPDLRGKLFAWSPVLLIAGWRINEIVYAFYKDALDSLENRTRESALTSGDRFRMLLRSYLSLWLCFATLYFLLPTSQSFQCEMQNFGDALFFSAATQTSLGQEGLNIDGVVERALAIYQVVAGLVLLVLAVSAYGIHRTHGPWSDA
jgi:voltage-gated potassium channel